MVELIKRHHISFKNAFAGLKWALATQPNFKVHILLALVAVFLGLVAGLSRLEWAVVVFTIFWALACEMINTAIESICDLVTKEWKEEIKIAKDVSAGMMLTVAFGSILVAILLILPKLLTKI